MVLVNEIVDRLLNRGVSLEQIGVVLKIVGLRDVLALKLYKINS